MRNAEYFLIGLLVNIPSVLTALVCIIVAAVLWKRHPKTSALVIVSMVWLTLQMFVSEAVFFFAPQWFIEQGKISSLDTFYNAAGIFNNIMSALALGLLLLAVFSNRTPTKQTV